MNTFWKLIVSTFGVVAVGALVGFGSIRADVSTLKEQRPVLEERMQAVEQHVSALKAATDTRAAADKEHRQRLNLDINTLDGKLDRLLERR